MRLVDWLVSRSLEMNNACLRYLAESQVRGHGVVTVERGEGALDVQAIYSESVVASDSRRILSMWRLVQPRLPKASTAVGHVHQLERIVASLAVVPAPRRLSLSLASQAVEDDNAKLMLRLARSLPMTVGPDWAELNEVFTVDSALWRDADNFTEMDDTFLTKRLGRSYRHGFKQAAWLRAREGGQDKADHEVIERLDILTDACQLAAHHMELLRPVMSDTQKHQYWYLDKLEVALRTRRGLRHLIRVKTGADWPKKAAKRARKYLESQEIKVNKRIDRLLRSAFALKPKKFVAQQRQALDRLALSSVSKVAVAKADAAENDAAAGRSE